jgi:hypothetical protein
MTTSIFDGWIYDHAQYTIVLETLAEEIERVLSGSSPIVFPLLGDSRAGKTALLNDIATRFAGQLGPSGHRRVMVVPMPTPASLEALAVRIIQTILGDIRIKGKTYQILNQAREVMEKAGLKVLLVDETNHLVEKRTSEKAQTRENRQTADWFKELGDISGISVVVTGLSHVSRMYSDNDQLENRGLVGARIHPYAWSVQGDRVEFQNTISAGLAHMLEHGWSIGVQADLLTRVAYFGGGGYIGKARDFLVRIEEIGNTHKKLDVKLLARAYKDKYRLDSHGDPTLLKAIDDVMLNGAHQKALQRAIKSGRGH